MLTVEPNIVFVDDKEKEVEGIVNSYREEGYSVKFFNSDIVTGNKKPKNEYSDVNLIFLDLYYSDIFDVEFCTAWVEKIVLENSFYVLVIWSKDTQHEEEVVRELTKLNRKPFKVISIQKGDDYKTTDNEWDFPKLHKYVSAELNKIYELEELSIWKKSIKSSSNLILGHLSNGASIDELRKKLQKIILGHGGSHLIGNDNSDEKRKVLFDALDNILSSNSKSTRPKKDISEANINALYNTSVFPVTDVDSKLNSWFHFKLIKKEEIAINDITPGLICLNKHRLFKQVYSIIDDPKLTTKFIKQKENATTVLSDIAVIMNRPCDMAQNKYGKNIKLLSGVRIDNPYKYKLQDLSTKQKKKKDDYLGKHHFNNEQLPDSIIAFHHLEIGTVKDVSLLFDFRYVFSVPETIFIDKFKNIKIFNKELLSEIQVEYSSYSSRLGITQII